MLSVLDHIKCSLTGARKYFSSLLHHVLVEYTAQKWSKLQFVWCFASLWWTLYSSLLGAEQHPLIGQYYTEISIHEQRSGIHVTVSLLTQFIQLYPNLSSQNQYFVSFSSVNFLFKTTFFFQYIQEMNLALQRNKCMIMGHAHLYSSYHICFTFSKYLHC